MLSGQDNVITLTFDDDSYNFSLVFDDKPNSGTTAATHEQIDISNGLVASGSAADIKTKIDAAVAANNRVSGVTTAANGKVLTLTITDGSKVEILRDWQYAIGRYWQSGH